MKLRILNFHVTATHDLISTLGSIAEPVSISDFHAFIYDPAGGLMTPGTSSLDTQRRQAEIRDLIHKKGGIVVCILRPDLATDWALDSAAPNIAGFVRNVIRRGAGSQLRILPSAKGASVGYFQVLKGALSFAAHLEASESVAW